MTTQHSVGGERSFLFGPTSGLAIDEVAIMDEPEPRRGVRRQIITYNGVTSDELRFFTTDDPPRRPDLASAIFGVLNSLRGSPQLALVCTYGARIERDGAIARAETAEARPALRPRALRPRIDAEFQRWADDFRVGLISTGRGIDHDFFLGLLDAAQNERERAETAEREREEARALADAASRERALWERGLHYADLGEPFVPIAGTQEERDAERDGWERGQELRALRTMRDHVGALLVEHGCSCDCGHDSEGHDADCDRCLACGIQRALNATKGGAVARKRYTAPAVESSIALETSGTAAVASLSERAETADRERDRLRSAVANYREAVADYCKAVIAAGRKVTTIDLDELEARAKAATPGPWLIERRDMGSGEIIHIVYGAHDVTWSGDEACPNARADARYIAAASPDVVLALIAEVRAARKAAAQRSDDEINDACDDRGPREWRS